MARIGHMMLLNESNDLLNGCTLHTFLFICGAEVNLDYMSRLATFIHNTVKVFIN